MEWLGAVLILNTITCPHAVSAYREAGSPAHVTGRRVSLILASWFPGRWLSQVNTVISRAVRV